MVDEKKKHAQGSGRVQFEVTDAAFTCTWRETTKITTQDNLSQGQESNSGPPEYGAGMLITRLRSSVALNKILWGRKRLTASSYLNWPAHKIHILLSLLISHVQPVFNPLNFIPPTKISGDK
jgi:hypothetical protein